MIRQESPACTRPPTRAFGYDVIKGQSNYLWRRKRSRRETRPGDEYTARRAGLMTALMGGSRQGRSTRLSGWSDSSPPALDELIRRSRARSGAPAQRAVHDHRTCFFQSRGAAKRRKCCGESVAAAQNGPSATGRAGTRFDEAHELEEWRRTRSPPSLNRRGWAGGGRVPPAANDLRTWGGFSPASSNGSPTKPVIVSDLSQTWRRWEKLARRLALRWARRRGTRSVGEGARRAPTG